MRVCRPKGVTCRLETIACLSSTAIPPVELDQHVHQHPCLLREVNTPRKNKLKGLLTYAFLHAVLICIMACC